MPGRYLEQFTVGEVIHYETTRTVTETDNIIFSSITMNPQPLHIDYYVAAQSAHRRPVVNAIYVMGLMMGITVKDTTLGTTEGGIVFELVEFPHPVFYHDTIRVETEVLSIEPSVPKPTLGTVRLEHRAINMDGEVVVRARGVRVVRSIVLKPVA